MHIQIKCLNLICQLNSNLQEKKTLESSLQSDSDELLKKLLMTFRIHNSKLEPWNNSCKFVSITQLQCYASSPIHLKDNTKQNNNEHKWNIRKGGEVFTYGCINSIVMNSKENLPP
jgi:hypothetical protein